MTKMQLQCNYSMTEVQLLILFTTAIVIGKDFEYSDYI
jgi:hypothetical protein